jgi:acid phosphatase type 7
MLSRRRWGSGTLSAMTGRTRSSVAAVAVLVVVAVVVAACGNAANRPSGDPRTRVESAQRAVVSRLALVGDIACDPLSPYYNRGHGDRQHCRQRAVGQLVQRLAPDAVITTGDNQYEVGGLRAYRRSYDAAFGDLLPITWPVAGNHEYGTTGATGYFRYFAARAGTPDRPWRWYAPADGWRVALLDSNCPDVGGCGPSSAQGRWLRRSLALDPTRCTIAVWHHPLHTAGAYRRSADTKALARPLWRASERGGVDLVVNGHDHSYQRFDAVDGMVEFVSGAGGKSHYALGRAKGLLSGNDTDFGVLLLTLFSDGTYRHAFVTLGGGRADVGRGRCANPPT